MAPITVGGRELNVQQSEAALAEEPTVLVLAGAGTGKTTTLVGRVSVLLDRGVDPSFILLISLTNNTVEDLRRALRREFGEGFGASVMTIHALGSRISGMRPCVGRQRTGLIGRIMSERASEDPRFASDVLEWVEGMRSSGYADTCLDGGTIGHRGLRAIADELFRRGVPYEFERQSVSPRGTVPAHLDMPSVGIRVGADDKVAREASRDPGGAALFASRAFPQSRPMDVRRLAAAVLDAWGDRIPSSVGAAVSRCKCARASVPELRSRVGLVAERQRDRVSARLRVLDTVWDMYSLECMSEGLADFEDMVTIATSMVRGGHRPHMMYRHVLIDEYQDATPILVDLICSLRDVWGFDLFCAGDDWQSIYSFAGGDVWQTYGFEDRWRRWGPVSVRRVERTYRCPQQIADMAGRFVSKNPSQMRKSIVGVPSERYPVHLLPVSGDREIPSMVANRLALIDPDESVFILGRTRADVYALGSGTGQFLFRTSDPSGTQDVALRRMDEESGDWVTVRGATFMTAHSSKGLEADWVFVLADRERGSGFPSTVSDPMDALFLTRREGVELAEERRVLYVAMTRARKGLFIVNRTEEDGYAISAVGRFTSEIVADNARDLARTVPFCPECTGPMRIVASGEGMFWGCCSYPRCHGTRRISDRPFRRSSRVLDLYRADASPRPWTACRRQS